MEADVGEELGVPFIEVDPACTSQRCPRCGHTGRANRRIRGHFGCVGAASLGLPTMSPGPSLREGSRRGHSSTCRPRPRRSGDR
ncbi:zinc ribbon domain-containing protein [Streptomyces sp. NPDC091376]|uniref:zinc ribbon domain-containing protein n=1 Tax=Streptomyces sp. NPDC091376 TaxID=3365994 RepID=UPI003810C6E7